MSSKNKGCLKHTLNCNTLLLFISSILFFNGFLNLFAEIIYVNSTDSSSINNWSDSTATNSWEGYFPKTYSGSVRRKIDARKFKNPKKTEKQLFDEREKVLGLPSDQFCEDNGIKPFAPAIAKPFPKGKGKKKM
jgi:hypothetical protein